MFFFTPPKHTRVITALLISALMIQKLCILFIVQPSKSKQFQDATSKNNPYSVHPSSFETTWTSKKILCFLILFSVNVIAIKSLWNLSALSTCFGILSDGSIHFPASVNYFRILQSHTVFLHLVSVLPHFCRWGFKAGVPKLFSARARTCFPFFNVGPGQKITC